MGPQGRARWHCVQVQLQIHVLDDEAAAGSPHSDRLQHETRGSSRLRNHLRTGTWILWLYAGAFLAGSQDSCLRVEWAGEEVLAGCDTVKMVGVCRGAGFRIGFGEVSGEVLPAHQV